MYMYPLLARNPEGYADSLRSTPGNFSHTDHSHAPTTCTAGASRAATVAISLGIARDTLKPLSSRFLSRPVSRIDPLDDQYRSSAAEFAVRKTRLLRLERKRRLNPILATALLHLPAFPKLRRCRVEAAVSAATTDQPFPRLHTRRKQATLRDRLTRPP